jgi:hypothetical protein
MNIFLRDSLIAFAGCAALGMLPPAVLAAKARKPTAAVIAVLTAAFVIFVLATSAAALSP